MVSLFCVGITVVPFYDVWRHDVLTHNLQIFLSWMPFHIHDSMFDKTHPRRTRGVIARRSSCGEFILCRYNGCTVL